MNCSIISKFPMLRLSSVQLVPLPQPRTQPRQPGEVVSFVQDGATVLPACGVAALPLEQEPMRAAFSPSAILNATPSANGEPSSPLRLT